MQHEKGKLVEVTPSPAVTNLARTCGRGEVRVMMMKFSEVPSVVALQSAQYGVILEMKQ